MKIPRFSEQRLCKFMPRNNMVLVHPKKQIQGGRRLLEANLNIGCHMLVIECPRLRIATEHSKSTMKLQVLTVQTKNSNKKIIFLGKILKSSKV